jgi:hypothetical protein
MTARRLLYSLSLMLLGSGFLQADNYSPRVGQPHPDFLLPRIDNGQAVRLSQFRGKRVLLVHFASW